MKEILLSQITKKKLLAVSTIIIIALTETTGVCADDGVLDVTGWKKNTSPFSDDSNETPRSIIGSVDIDSRLGVKANVEMKCNKEGVLFIVGLANGTFDIITTNHVHDNTYPNFLSGQTEGHVYTTQEQWITIHEKLAGYNQETLEFQPENSNKFSYYGYSTNYLVKSDSYLIGAPMNGTEIALRIPLQDKVVAEFLQPCFLMEKKSDAANKAAEETEQEEERAAENQRRTQQRTVEEHAKKCPLIQAQFIKNLDCSYTCSQVGNLDAANACVSENCPPPVSQQDRVACGVHLQ